MIMYDFNKYVESGAFSGTEPARFYINPNVVSEHNLSKSDEVTGNELNSLTEFGTKKGIELFDKPFKLK
jgi:hypothetical protein